jgi:hypothetical protein
MALRTAPIALVSRRLVVLLVVLALAPGAAPSSARAEPVVLLGLYPPGLLQFQEVVDTMLHVDEWLTPTGKRVSIAGGFMDIELDPAFSVPAELDGAWNNGYVPFVNLTISHSTAVTASGAIDPAIREWARHFAVWTDGGQKRAFLAPMQEMNGRWTPYFGHPLDFVRAFRQVRSIFDDELTRHGVPHTAISWVFAPSGWSEPGYEFERYYPGHDVVDVVSFSAYNYGSCAGTEEWVRWETYDLAIKPYLDRMRLMAPSKPLFIAETGVVDAPVQGVGDKDQWLYETFTRLAAYPGVRGVLYFNTQNTQANLPHCLVVDYRLHEPETNRWPGFWNAMLDTPNYAFWAPDSAEMESIAFGREPAPVFTDVPTIHPFALERGQVDWAPWIHALYAAGITAGCSTTPLRYCPDAGVTRGQMAVFLMRGVMGNQYLPPAATGTRFGDVHAEDPFASWIEALAAAGITGGCGNGNFCPDNVVTRAEMAVFLMRAMLGPGYTPSAATGTRFDDVPVGNPFAPWIEALAAHGITGGCGGGLYCPGTAVNRAQMAIFLVRTFALPMQ